MATSSITSPMTVNKKAAQAIEKVLNNKRIVSTREADIIKDVKKSEIKKTSFR